MQGIFFSQYCLKTRHFGHHSPPFPLAGTGPTAATNAEVMLLIRTWLLVVGALVGICVLIGLAASAVAEEVVETGVLSRAQRIVTLYFVPAELDPKSLSLKGPEL